MSINKTADIRRSFLEYFRERNHTVVPSSPVIPADDPTILFTNAGMNQFKEVFTGRRKVNYSRAASSQKCIRAGGKHNDLDNVGFTARHHTFFEMLGNFSFGDYFKEEAITFAWEWVTKVIGLPADRLYATVYETDDDAFRLWEKVAPPLKNGRVLRFGKKDNFWSMGDIGPCGPCSEIHFDRGEKYGTGPNDTVNGETDRFVEVWNLVFMQYDQQPDGQVVPLPKPSVDTGAGLERLACVLQGVDTNYQIDLFRNLVAAISDLTGGNYKKQPASHHVVADHIRALTFAIADGAGISNEGRGYVLRRILRRAARHGRQLGAHEPFIYKLVPVLVNEMGGAYPEIKEKQAHVQNVIKAEEESFLRTLDTGLELFEKVARQVRASGTKVVPGEEVFKLYDTYGFPYDLTETLAIEQGMTLDQAGFDTAMRRQQEKSRSAAQFGASFKGTWEPPDTIAVSHFLRDRFVVEATVRAVHSIDSQLLVVTDQTPFYVEAGGQISDTGTLTSGSQRYDIVGVYNSHDRIVHVCAGKGADSVRVGAAVSLDVTSSRRWDIMRNHTATHLTHAALRKVLGDPVKQSGSYVGPDRLRFDFSHHQPMSPEQISEIERLVNEQILKGTDVVTEEMPIEKAKATGAMALFGEKYGDTVRVVQVPGFSKELCGGTHVSNTSQIGPFFVTLETGIASGVRRIEAITGRKAIAFMLESKEFRRKVAQAVSRPESEALAGIEQLREEHGSFQKEIKRLKQSMFSGGAKTVGQAERIGPLTLATHDFGDTDKDTIAAWLDTQKGKPEPVVAIGLGKVDGKQTFMAAASSQAVDSLKIDIGAVSKEVLPQFGGRGGGKPSFAQGGVATETIAGQLFERIRVMLSAKIPS